MAAATAKSAPQMPEVKETTLDDSLTAMREAVVSTEEIVNDIQATLGIVPSGRDAKALEEPDTRISERIFRSQALGDRVRDITNALFEINEELRRL